jgi:hypothetical protein
VTALVMWILWALPIALLCLGTPIYVCFLAAAIAALLFITNVPTSVIPQVIFGSVDSFTLLAVPFFLFAGELMGRGDRRLGRTDDVSPARAERVRRALLARAHHGHRRDRHPHPAQHHDDPLLRLGRATTCSTSGASDSGLDWSSGPAAGSSPRSFRRASSGRSPG